MTLGDGIIFTKGPMIFTNVPMISTSGRMFFTDDCLIRTSGRIVCSSACRFTTLAPEEMLGGRPELLIGTLRLN
jgi:hypothetical protein